MQSVDDAIEGTDPGPFLTQGVLMYPSAESTHHIRLTACAMRAACSRDLPRLIDCAIAGNAKGLRADAFQKQALKATPAAAV